MIPSMAIIFILLAVIALIFLGRFSEIIIKCREAMGTCSFRSKKNSSESIREGRPMSEGEEGCGKRYKSWENGHHPKSRKRAGGGGMTLIPPLR